MSVESVQPQSPDLLAFPLPYPISKVIGTIGYICGQLWLLGCAKTVVSRKVLPPHIDYGVGHCFPVKCRSHSKKGKP